MHFSVEIYQGEKRLGRKAFHQGVVKVGRLPNSHLNLTADESVSRMHALFELESGTPHVVDLGSSTGTFLNGERVNKAVLRHGDDIVIGSYRLRVCTEEAADFRMIASGPAVNGADVETHSDAIEVVLMWGDNVLQVSHLDLEDTYVLGDPGLGNVHYPMSPEVLGTSRWVAIEKGQVLPRPAALLGQADGVATPNASQPIQAEGVHIALGEFELRVRRVRAAKRIATSVSIDRTPFMYVGGVMALCGLMLAALALVPPSASAISISHLDQDSRLLAVYHTAQALEEEPEPEPETGEAAGTEGQAHDGERGEMGDESAERTDSHYSVRGPRDTPEPQLSREAQREQAAEAGILGVMASFRGNFNSPTSPYGADQAIGRDAESYLGALTGNLPGMNQGAGGLDVLGTGRGAGGDGHGTVGLGQYGTLGHGCRGGNCAESGGQYGRVGNIAGRGRDGRVPPRIRSGPVTTRGGLSAETIRRVVRRHRNEVRYCYSQALQTRPDLEGRIGMRFLISSSGAVQTAFVSNSTLQNQSTERCVTDAVRRWVFPAPEDGGLVSVNYPFVFTPAGG